MIRIMRLILLNSFIRIGISKTSQRMLIKEIRQITIIAPERFLPVIHRPLKQK